MSPAVPHAVLHGVQLEATLHERSGRSERLIILDWDDTVIPTSHLVLSEENVTIKEDLDAFAEEAEQFLKICLSLGQVVLCTNAESWWPASSVWTYFPSLGPWLDQIPIVSAQCEYAPMGFKDPFDWKRLAFKQILSSYPDATNILSIGDAWYERGAVIDACQEKAACGGFSVSCKSVKFVEAPNIKTLMDQQAKCRASLAQVMNHPGCLDIFLPRSDPQGLACAPAFMPPAANPR